MTSETHLIDCMELMAKYPDGYFDLACVEIIFVMETKDLKSLKCSLSRKSVWKRF